MVTSFARVLPLPPSANRLTRRGKGGKHFRTKDYQDFLDEVAVLCHPHRDTLRGDLVAELQFYQKDSKRDLDNGAKPVLDALEQAGIYGNDNQIVELHLYDRGSVGRNGDSRVEVRIWERG